jgi:hypothetical protein
MGYNIGAASSGDDDDEDSGWFARSERFFSALSGVVRKWWVVLKVTVSFAYQSLPLLLILLLCIWLADYADSRADSIVKGGYRFATGYVRIYGTFQTHYNAAAVVLPDVANVWNFMQYPVRGLFYQVRLDACLNWPPKDIFVDCAPLAGSLDFMFGLLSYLKVLYNIVYAFANAVWLCTGAVICNAYPQDNLSNCDFSWQNLLKFLLDIVLWFFQDFLPVVLSWLAWFNDTVIKSPDMQSAAQSGNVMNVWQVLTNDWVYIKSMLIRFLLNNTVTIADLYICRALFDPVNCFFKPLCTTLLKNVCFQLNPLCKIFNLKDDSPGCELTCIDASGVCDIFPTPTQQSCWRCYNCPTTLGPRVPCTIGEGCYCYNGYTIMPIIQWLLDDIGININYYYGSPPPNVLT